jgi:hypothetical protein
MPAVVVDIPAVVVDIPAVADIPVADDVSRVYQSPNSQLL